MTLLSISMLTSSEEHNNLYIIQSKINIDEYIQKKYYSKAFILLIQVLEKLDENEKIEFINYYSTKIDKLNVIESPLVLTRLNCRKM